MTVNFFLIAKRFYQSARDRHNIVSNTCGSYIIILNAVQLRYIMEAEAIRRAMEPSELIKRVCFTFWKLREIIDMSEGLASAIMHFYNLCVFCFV